MKILRIRLENFASHTNTEIDLAGITSATITGKNGAGKSTAFVDGPLWILWGKCRSDIDSMFPPNAQRLSGELDFLLDGKIYRIQRVRSLQTKAGKTELAFLLKHGEQWTPIGGHTIAETQQAIKNVLSADYELCANTNFLIQGQADKFTTASAAERKAILSQVLRLDEYGELRTVARRRVVQKEEQIKGLLAQVQPLEVQVLEMPLLEEQIKAAEVDQTIAVQEQTQIANLLKAHHQAKGEQEATYRQLLGLKDRQDTLVAERDVLHSKIDRNVKNQAYYQKLLEQKDTIQREALEYEQTLQDVAKYKDTENQFMKSLIEVDAAIKVATERQWKEEATLQRVNQELEALNHKVELANNQKNLELGNLSNQIGQDRQKGKLLELVPCWEELQKKCPFTIEAVDAMAGLEGKQAQISVLEKRDFVMEQMPNYADDCKTRQAQIESLKQTDTKAKIAALNAQREGIARDKARAAQEAESSTKAANIFKPSFEKKPELQAAIQEVAKFVEWAQAYQLELKKIEKELEVIAIKLQGRTALETWLANAKQEEDALTGKQTFLAGRIAGLVERLGGLKESLKQALIAQKKVLALQEDIKTTTLEHYASKRLADYYTTIPIMIMEGAVPNLEAKANDILAKVSPNGMRIRLETQRALKSSDKIGETLDILVSDVFGEKPYENYSGGEKFRLDFALRFGLAQLLMHRAGAGMETLVIDEGLGSLDEDGLTLLRECLSRLEDSFGLILVISHVKGIQGTFEQEIQVERTPTGTEVKVL
jgi:exonuclease SbcC